MFKLSRAAEYAIRGILHLSIHYHEDRVIDIEEIAKSQNIPPAYLAKLLQELARKGFLKSYKGQQGGFVLIKPPKLISLLDVIEAMEGPIFLNYCLIYSGYCDRELACPVHDVWVHAQKLLVDYLSNCNFEELALATKAKTEALQALEKK